MLIDQKDRDSIRVEKDSLLISASAGSGKTTIMIEKIKKVLNDIESHKTIAAITFTIKATKEIRKKSEELGVEKSFVASTNNAFVEMEIIRPFIKDAFGEGFDRDFLIEFDRNHQFINYEQGLHQLKYESKLGGYEDNNRNFIFEVALNILFYSRAAREYLQAKYTMIFIDEYQDSDKDMHKLFMYFYNTLQLKLFIVGDEKQAIYHWRGADENIFKRVPSSFKKYSLIKNFRCDNEILNYANLLYEPDYFDNDNPNIVKNVIHVVNNDLVKSIVHLIENEQIDITKEITIIARRNDEAKSYAEELQGLGYDFIFIPRTPLDEGTPNSSILIEIAKFIIQKRYSVYDLIVQTDIDENLINVRKLKRLLDELDFEIKLNKHKQILHKCCSYLGINLTEEEQNKFYQTMWSEDSHVAFEKRKDIHQIMTVYSAKGLEFDQVISKSNYYNIQQDRDRQNHYVCITRAKEKLVMLIDDRNYERFVTGKSTKLGMQDSNKLYKKINV